MQFSDELEFNTFSDAWQTFKTYFNDGSITFEQFYNATRERKLISRTIKDLIDNPPENIALNRIRAKSATDAYPENNRPRGLADIKSVQYHMKSITVPPVFMVEWKTKDGVRTIFLDGMHRIVAASISKKRKIPIFLITI